MVDEQNTGATNDLGPLETADGGPVDPNAPPTPLVDPGVDLSGATITPIANDPPSDDAGSPAPTEAADRTGPGLDATVVVPHPGFTTSTGSGQEATVADPQQFDREARMWSWFDAIGRQETAGLHPNIFEALKRLELARGEFAKATENIDGQYLKSLDRATPDHAAQAAAVRMLMSR